MSDMDGKTEDEMRNELQDLQMNANAVTDDSLESTRRMLAMCEESQDVGIKTLTMLDQQGEQLDRIDEGMDQINQDMKDAEKNLEGMEKCCGLCVLPWKKSKNFEKGGEFAKAWGKNDDGQVNQNGPRMQVGNEMVMSGNLVTRITNDTGEDEMEQIFGEFFLDAQLRNMAVEISNEIESQNRQLDRINIKGESLDDRVKVAKVRANKIIRNQ